MQLFTQGHSEASTVFSKSFCNSIYSVRKRYIDKCILRSETIRKFVLVVDEKQPCCCLIAQFQGFMAVNSLRTRFVYYSCNFPCSSHRGKLSQLTPMHLSYRQNYTRWDICTHRLFNWCQHIYMKTFQILQYY